MRKPLALALGVVMILTLALAPVGAESDDLLEARDAIIAAEAALTGDPANGVRGEDECLIWETFARRGLGVDADAGDFLSKTDQVESFDVPAHCE